jgi:hypothetical protein
MKKRPVVALGIAAAIVLAHLAMRALGMAVHTSAVAGMPVDDSSLALGPLYIAVYLLAVVVAPVLAIAGFFELFALARQERLSAPGSMTSRTE